MRLIILLFILLALAVGVYVLASGSQWTSVPGLPLHVYGHTNGPIDSLPVIANLQNERVELDQCYFDKSDAYFRVRYGSNSAGYAFDHDQKFEWTWHRPAVWNFNHAYDCWRLVAQFGRD